MAGSPSTRYYRAGRFGIVDHGGIACFFYGFAHKLAGRRVGAFGEANLLLDQIAVRLDFRMHAVLFESTSGSGYTSAARHLSHRELDHLSVR